MTPPVQRRRWPGIPARAIPALILAATFVILMSLAISTARNISRGEALAVAAAEATVTRSAIVAQSLLDRHLLQVEGQLAGLSDWLQHGFISAADPGRASLALQQLASHSYTHRNLMLTDAQGEVWASAVTGGVGHSLPISRGVLEAAAREGSASLHGPLRNADSGLTMLLLLRRVGQDAAGRPILAAAEIPTALLTAVLAPMVTPPELRVRLENRDGLILAAGAGQTHLIGQVLPRSPASGLRLVRLERRTDRLGPGEVFATARPTMLQGLFAVAELPEAAALAGWPQLRLSILTGSGIAALLLVALAAALFFAVWNGQRAATEREGANTRLLAAIESLPDGFAFWDPEDRLVICNSRYRDFHDPMREILVPGLRFEELAKAWIADGTFNLPEIAPEQRLAHVLDTHRSPGGQRERQLRDGRWLRIAQRRMPGSGMVVILTEITALKQAMTELAEARDTADRATRAKANLLAHVSHELRTPLASLLRLADALQREAGLPPPQRHQAGLVGATARHLLALANEVLDLAAMEAQSLTLHPSVAQPADIFREAIAMVQPLAEARQVRIAFTEEALPPHIEVDATRLRQMVLNLLSNAVKFTPDGSEVRLLARAEADRLRFEVSDQGSGVPEAERPQLFRDFTRLASSQQEGTGLGLSITARLAHLMGGEIGCTDAQPGPGACFWMEMPIRRAAPPAPEQEAIPTRSPGHRLRLLAVDDAPSNLSVLRALLAQHDLDLETVNEGPAALEAVEIAAREGRPFDVVLMDVMMPGMDGKETTRRLRAMPGTIGRMPVIAVTASAFPDDLAETRAAGMDGHVIKPVDRALLLRALADAVARPTAGGPGAQVALETLRPMLLAELDLRLTQLELALRDGTTLIPTVHALAGTVGHLGAPRQVTRTRRVLQALREADPDGPKLARALLDELRFSFPDASPRAAAS
ncbi:ATP-binding protein [Sediminicoccus sp. KRV36]|uniref:hybrid sensor histidine kinase/response regulator n=1 Tax=Sediminicoccus sp. KRV36 TaxID=3133721 RepID=UPI00200C58B8|nr:ATP-binding protein [Sediminicoccus rosea]UPY34870.1 response regulator [Sediminicoccus rosea]